MARRRGSKDQLTVFGALEAEHPATQVDDLADSIRKAVASHPALRVLTAVAAVSGVQGDFVPHPAYTRQGRGVDFPGYSFSKSAQVMCRPCSRTAVLEHNGYHPKLAGREFHNFLRRAGLSLHDQIWTHCPPEYRQRLELLVNGAYLPDRIDEAITVAERQGYANGLEEGQELGYARGFAEGRMLGAQEGFDAGLQEARSSDDA